MKIKKFIITGFSEIEERENPQQLHGMLVVTGGKDMKMTVIEEGEDNKTFKKIIE